MKYLGAICFGVMLTLPIKTTAFWQGLILAGIAQTAYILLWNHIDSMRDELRKLNDRERSKP